MTMTEPHDFDYSALAEQQTAPADALAQLSQLARAHNEAEKKVLSIELELKAAKAVVTRIEEQDIPELMLKCKVENFKTTDGFTIVVKKQIRANIKASNRPEAFAWLIKSGNEGLIKHDVSVTLGKGEEQKASELELQLVQDGYAVASKSSVHAGTLSAFVRGELEAGRAVPHDLLSVYEQRVAKITTK